jgi:hypothetical protein
MKIEEWKLEIDLRRGERKNRGAGKSKMYCKHICKYHDVSPVQLLYANKIFKENRLAYMWGFIPRLSILFHLSTSMSLCQYYMI